MEEICIKREVTIGVFVLEKQGEGKIRKTDKSRLLLLFISPAHHSFSLTPLLLLLYLFPQWPSSGGARRAVEGGQRASSAFTAAV